MFFRCNESIPLDSLNYFSESIFNAAKDILQLFYIVNPSETIYEDPETVTNFYQNAWPYFLLFIFLENLILWIERKPSVRLNDCITSLSHGLIQECGRLLFRSSESYLYFYIYNNYSIYKLDWNSFTTWYVAVIGVDFCYYWAHRASHEIHIFWAQHQVHHSSEDYNLAVGLRQSIFQGWCGFVFYLPLALLIPPSHFITHQHLNLLFQFWLHTETVKNLGLLEYIINTPNHHRVHHGSNIYCLDKNYGGILIIWDRVFGTFAEENREEEIIYGLVYNQPSFNVLHLQTFYTKYVLQKFTIMTNWKDKLRAIFYGPSWQPGKPRLGCDQDKVKVTKRIKYDVKLPLHYNIYLLLHFIVLVIGFQQLNLHHLIMNSFSIFISITYIIVNLTNIGLLFEKQRYAASLEILRCFTLFVITLIIKFPNINDITFIVIRIFLFMSLTFWLVKTKPVF